ncbi:hypothetical protein [Actinomadura hibisca]|uniref:hypothetical protein n=1 Tax=Actinomadura hibisca TaxID=68565 RepID=UPI0008341CA3|nr:hypothetical protein [Actinomadura hibisca]
MGVDELLQEIEPLTYRARCERLAACREQAPELLETLRYGDHYERSLALFIAGATRDEASLAHIARAMRDPDSDLAVTAINLAARHGLGPDTFDLDDAPQAFRDATYRAIRKWQRTDLAEHLLDRVLERWGQAEAAKLLPACTEATVRERIDGLAHVVPNWKALGRAHPAAVLDHAERHLPDLPEYLLNHWWWWHAAGIGAAARHDPARVVTLLERHWKTTALPQGLVRHVAFLLDAEPDRMWSLLLSNDHKDALARLLDRRAVRDRVARLDDDPIARIGHALADQRGQLLRAFPPSRRAHVFDLAVGDRDRSTAEVFAYTMELMPHALRAREARRMLGLRRITDHPGRRWETTAYLPFDEAEPVLRELTRRPDADERATGYRLLFACAGRTRDPDVLTRLLDTTDRLRNEQDPVRVQALGALANVPPGMFRAEHGDALTRLTTDALNARDCSHQTRAQLQNLAARVCHQGAARLDERLLHTGLGIVDRLSVNLGYLHLARLDTVLRRGREHDLIDVLAERLAAGTRTGDHRLALTLAASLRRRAYELTPLQDALEAAVFHAKDETTICAALSFWLASPRTRADRVGRLVTADRSAYAMPEVFETVARERLDLLPDALSGRRVKGRFPQRRNTNIPYVSPTWMRRWTTGHRAAYLRLLHAFADDPAMADLDRAHIVRLIGEVPGTGTDELRRHLDSDDALLRRAALTAVPWTSAPQQVFAPLLEHAGGDDAHVATYAATRAARYVEPSRLGGLLAPVLADGKITARKEALRILLHTGAPDAMERIAAAWELPGQHRDVRAAIVSAARQRLDHPVAARILDQAADGPRDLARFVVGASPLAMEERFRDRYADLVLRVARSDDVELREIAIPSLPQWTPWAADAPALLAAYLTDLDRTDTWKHALSALVACVSAGTGTDALSQAAATLAAAADDGPEAEAERDLPARQRLQALVMAARQRFGDDRDGGERVARALHDHLPEPLASILIAGTMRWDSPDTAQTVDALADRPMGGVLAVRDVAEALVEGPFVTDGQHFIGLFSGYAVVEGVGYPEPEEVLPHAVRLAARGDLTGGLFACALAFHHGHRGTSGGWAAGWRALLRDLRAHPHPEVAYAARNVRTAME